MYLKIGVEITADGEIQTQCEGEHATLPYIMGAIDCIMEDVIAEAKEKGIEREILLRVLETHCAHCKEFI